MKEKIRQAVFENQQKGKETKRPGNRTGKHASRTELVFVLDRSGSMWNLAKDTVRGFNHMLKEQSLLEDECFVTTVLFSHEIENLHDGTPLGKVQPMYLEDYQPHGSTALYDALGLTIARMVRRQKSARKEDRADKVMFVIITDGQENASELYTRREVKKMIEFESQVYDWEFIFLGANIDAKESARVLGISPAHAANYMPDSQGTELNFKVVSEAVCSFRQSSCLNKDALKPIEEDEKRRNPHSRSRK